MDVRDLADGRNLLLLLIRAPRAHGRAMPVSLTRTVRFPARHRMYRADWPEARNRETFGPLADYHPHDYTCLITVGGRLDPDSGMVMDLVLLDRILEEEVLHPLAGQILNERVTFEDHQPPATCEAIAAWIFARVAARLPVGVSLERVRIAEDPTLYADCTG